MRILRYFLSGITMVVLLFAAVAYFLPSTYTITQQVLIQAPSEQVFAQVNSLQNWDHWAFSYREADQRQQVTYTGPAEGVGNRQMWQMPDGVQGQLEIVASHPYDSVVVRMVTNGGAFVSEGRFELTEKDAYTLLRWEEKGDFGMNLFARFYASLAGFESKVSGQYQQALEVLKAYCEAGRQ